ncbi:hypothetical protein CBM2615_B110043 [Cupriavidus taiwanensis]|uniref:Uncharacterized protein n=1 Tax=Cupriavidus taiwanensis TaxID=164546 RepID=A0A375EFU9_9BURK|nr:hypothetical protein CBM2614_B110043 [Cupriavidus taiwanensis]SOZ63200.1 hypothetical protein CBM2615_B110043 [Cupriavidus taiwanensis]SOZ74177.1 hypothetical protein CBM2613_B80041 [Cupriavidus taiwanensis]SPA11079.1 hypothetical protein CBM2625_B90043 [Cupriavidus taiwanensis]
MVDGPVQPAPCAGHQLCAGGAGHRRGGQRCRRAGGRGRGGLCRGLLHLGLAGGRQCAVGQLLSDRLPRHRRQLGQRRGPDGLGSGLGRRRDPAVDGARHARVVRVDRRAGADCRAVDVLAGRGQARAAASAPGGLRAAAAPTFPRVMALFRTEDCGHGRRPATWRPRPAAAGWHLITEGGAPRVQPPRQPWRQHAGASEVARDGVPAQSGVVDGGAADGMDGSAGRPGAGPGRGPAPRGGRKRSHAGLSSTAGQAGQSRHRPAPALYALGLPARARDVAHRGYPACEPAAGAAGPVGAGAGRGPL